MIKCSNCQYENVSGTLFCAECGVQLDGIETLTTQSITQDQIAEDLKTRMRQWNRLHRQRTVGYHCT